MRRTSLVLALALLLTACSSLGASPAEDRTTVIRERIARHGTASVADRLVRRFRQTAVLRMTLPARLEFISASPAPEAGQ